jgi:hypothetical protein
LGPFFMNLSYRTLLLLDCIPLFLGVCLA